MFGYYLERDKFIEIFQPIENLLIDKYDFSYENELIKIWYWEDEVFILEKQTGILVNWYKHLGRANYVNKKLTEKEIREFAVRVLLQLKE